MMCNYAIDIFYKFTTYEFKFERSAYYFQEYKKCVASLFEENRRGNLEVELVIFSASLKRLRKRFRKK